MARDPWRLNGPQRAGLNQQDRWCLSTVPMGEPECGNHHGSKSLMCSDSVVVDPLCRKSCIQFARGAHFPSTVQPQWGPSSVSQLVRQHFRISYINLFAQLPQHFPMASLAFRMFFFLLVM